MAQAKTRATPASVAAHLGAIADPQRRADCEAVAQIMHRVTGCPPCMWGTAIVGFDSYRYTYASGHSGESCVVGFASRKADLSVYLLDGYESVETQALLTQLGPHKVGKACLNIKRLSDVRLDVLETLITRSVAETRRRHPERGGAR